MLQRRQWQACGKQIQGEVLDERVQLHGGYGFMAEYPVVRMWTTQECKRFMVVLNVNMEGAIARSLDT